MPLAQTFANKLLLQLHIAVCARASESNVSAPADARRPAEKRRDEIIATRTKVLGGANGAQSFLRYLDPVVHDGKCKLCCLPCKEGKVTTKLTATNPSQSAKSHLGDSNSKGACNYASMKELERSADDVELECEW
jgi:hypothetical protein